MSFTKLIPFLMLFFCACQNIPSTEKDEAAVYDLTNNQIPVRSRKTVDSILQSLEAVPFNKLDKAYIKYSDSDGQFKSVLAKKIYYKVYGRDVFKYVAGKIRINDLLPQDSFYRLNMACLDSNYYQYWLIDKKLLYKTLDLLDELEKQGYDPYGYSVNHGHRHPKQNYEVNGALGSRHLYGEAIDLYIKDINKDGVADQTDKALVMDILEKKIIKDKGGIGRYPGSMVIHYDTRGYKRRWDAYTPANKLK